MGVYENLINAPPRPPMNSSLLPMEIEARVHAFVDQESIVALTDKRGTIVYANDRFCEISGYDRTELEGQNHRLLKSGRHPPEFYKALWATVLGGRTWRGEICNRAKDGHLYWVETTIAPLRQQGLITHFLAIRTDITERKEALEVLAQQQKREEEDRRMAALGRMADGVLHDLGNVLTGVMGLALETDLEARDAALQEAISRMAQVIRTLRDYSTGRPSKPELFLLNPLVGCVSSLVRHRKGGPRNLSIVAHCDSTSGCQILGNEGQVFEVVLNLMVNAVEAVTTVPEPEIRVYTTWQDGRVALTIEDNGGGVPPAAVATLFEPYSSSKGRGRGVGLSVAKRIAVAHGGDLRLEHAGGDGAGACFRLELPARMSEEAPVGSVFTRGTGRRFVLVSEDNAEVQRLIEHAAAKLGLTTVSPGDAADLIGSAAKLRGAVAAAVIDSCDADAEQGAVACLRRLEPELPILLVSGTLGRRGERTTKWGDVAMLPKPFALDELVAVLKSTVTPRG